MEKITGERCIELMKERFPRFLPYWDSFIRDFSSDEVLHVQMFPFEEYALDLIKSNNEIEIKKIFDLVEFLLCHGDLQVRSAISTGFLEHLISKDPEEIKFCKFVQYLGKNSLDYCRAWNKFTGLKTEGL